MDSNRLHNESELHMKTKRNRRGVTVLREEVVNGTTVQIIQGDESDSFVIRQLLTGGGSISSPHINNRTDADRQFEIALCGWRAW